MIISNKANESAFFKNDKIALHGVEISTQIKNPFHNLQTVLSVGILMISWCNYHGGMLIGFVVWERCSVMDTYSIKMRGFSRKIKWV